jgi:tight adherence protein B
VTAARARRRLGALRPIGPGRGSVVPQGSPPAVTRLAARARRAGLHLTRPGHDEVTHAVLLEGVARSLRGGTSLAQALDEGADAAAPSPAATDMARVLGLLTGGLGVSDAVDAWVGARPTPPRVLAGAALALGAEVGGAHAQSLDGAAAGLRDRAELCREVQALTSQARASAVVMVLAPLGFAAYAWTTDTHVAQLEMTTPFGWGCLIGGLALDLAGAAWMMRLTARAS